MRLWDKIEEIGVFTCAGCRRVFNFEKLVTLGTYIPRDLKRRVAAYAVCKACAKKTGSRWLMARAENWLECEGAFLDSDYYQFKMPTAEELERWSVRKKGAGNAADA